jgi:hypothetical protein
MTALDSEQRRFMGGKNTGVDKMMKRFLIGAIASVAVVAGVTCTAQAQSSATATGTATALLIQAIAIFEQRPLDFGTIVPPNTGTAFVTVTTTNTSGDHDITVTGGDALHLSGTGHNARFFVTGGAFQSYTVTGLPVVIDLGLLNAGATLSANINEVTPDATGFTIVDGTSWFHVGGVLTVPVGSQPGPYSGTYPITVSYN